MIDKQIKTNKTKCKSNCETCIHNVICKEKENYNKYVQELDELEINNAYFENVSRECRYYLNKNQFVKDENLFAKGQSKDIKNNNSDDHKTNIENILAEEVLDNIFAAFLK